jgi:hypothetical protein
MTVIVFGNRANAWMLGAGLALGILPPVSLALAEGLPITPGLWEIRTDNPMIGGEQVERHCMKDAIFDPVGLMGDKQGCEVMNETMTSNSIDYDLACNGEKPGQAEGHFSFTIDGDRGNGKVDLNMIFGDQSMTMQYTMDATRVGDC